MNLYEIDEAILTCINPETGEVDDLDRLTKLQMERDRKVENVACWVKNLRAESAALKTEADALLERRKKADEKADSLIRWLSEALNGAGFCTAKRDVSFRKSPGKLVVEDVNALPEEYTVEDVTVKPDKRKIKEAIRNGTDVPGASIEAGLSITIK